MGSPLVRVVVVNWNQWRTTLDTLEALERLDYPHFEVVVVDNGSSDDSADRLAAWLASRPRMSLIRLPENRGFAGGVNAGILTGTERAAETAGADYFWLLNNDALPEPSALGHLVMALERDSSAAAAGSLILYADAPSLVWAAGGDIAPWWGITRHRFFKAPAERVSPHPFYCDYAPGCSVLLRAEALRRVGLLDSSYFLYFEETDWQVRAARAGWRILTVPASRVYHKVSLSVGPRSPLQEYYVARNGMRFLRRYYPAHVPAGYLYFTVRRLMVKLLRGQFGKASAVARGLLGLPFDARGDRRSGSAAAGSQSRAAGGASL